MKVRYFALLLVTISLTSCGARKGVPSATQKAQEKSAGYADLPDFIDLTDEVIEDLETETFNIIDHALQFLGTKYKYGGTTPDGMDCSGLVYTCFLQNDISLPRSSKEMAQLGEQLELGNVRTGDLLFFITDRRKKNINHVGLVVELDADNIYFIHSSTSRGVIISALNENYWRDHFVMARRIL
ncbi:C40 family peptidase [Salinimicrobium sp. HB62]|uniref:C40 family peptidase n=1 Tax=Salinimicrobium sp. HB62 TaxID=3077781 RepID=UPI002D7A1F67|nr:C40 family peptidase [Salinimicrobium sp. HB62]